MKADLENHSGNGKAQGTEPLPAAMQPDRLVAAARDYFSSDFSNPSRSGCPPAGSFAVSLRAGKLPPDDLREHLFGCSECFREYREAAVRVREADAHGPSSWLGLPGRPRFAGVFVYTLVAALGLVTVAAFLVLRGGVAEERQVANNASQPAAPSTAAPSPAGASASAVTPSNASREPATAPPAANANAVASLNGRNPKRAESTARAVLIDLAAYSVLRAGDAEPGTTRGTTLPPAVNRLRILLPADSPRGVYRVAFVDAYGSPLLPERSAKSAGKVIEVLLDTRPLAGRHCMLRVSREGEAPDYYPVNVAGR